MLIDLNFYIKLLLLSSFLLIPLSSCSPVNDKEIQLNSRKRKPTMPSSKTVKKVKKTKKKTVSTLSKKVLKNLPPSSFPSTDLPSAHSVLNKEKGFNHETLSPKEIHIKLLPLSPPSTSSTSSHRQSIKSKIDSSNSDLIDPININELDSNTPNGLPINFPLPVFGSIGKKLQSKYGLGIGGQSHEDQLSTVEGLLKKEQQNIIKPEPRRSTSIQIQKETKKHQDQKQSKTHLKAFSGKIPSAFTANEQDTNNRPATVVESNEKTIGVSFQNQEELEKKLNQFNVLAFQNSREQDDEVNSMDVIFNYTKTQAQQELDQTFGISRQLLTNWSLLLKRVDDQDVPMNRESHLSILLKNLIKLWYNSTEEAKRKVLMIFQNVLLRLPDAFNEDTFQHNLTPPQPVSELQVPDYHLLIISSLIFQDKTSQRLMLRKIPKDILIRIAQVSPKYGLVPVSEMDTFFVVASYRTMSSDEETFKTKCTILKYSPWISSYIQKIKAPAHLVLSCFKKRIMSQLENVEITNIPVKHLNDVTLIRHEIYTHYLPKLLVQSHRQPSSSLYNLILDFE